MDPRYFAPRAVLDHVRVGQEADQQSTDESGDAVGVDDAECVIDLGEGTNLREVVPREPDDVDEVTPTMMAPVPLTQPAEGVMATSPQSIPLMAQERGFFCLERNMSQNIQVIHRPRSRHWCSDCRRRVGAGVERVTTVEPVPAEPDDARTDGHHHEVAREGVLPVLPATRTKDRRADKGRDPALKWMT